MGGSIEIVNHPELFFGIAGPIGVDLDQVIDALQEALRAVGYRCHPIRLTSELERFSPVPQGIPRDFHSQVVSKMERATELCRRFSDKALMARIAISAISDRRRSLSDQVERVPNAYIIRQLKRPTEVELLRRVYGELFVLVSAYSPVEQRARAITETLRRDPPMEPDEGKEDRTTSMELRENRIEAKARELISIDANEDTNAFGQRLSATYHMADVFVDGRDRSEASRMVRRFIEAFFGRTDIGPSKVEYGMYAAKSASLRSTDLSRQVGAAIFTEDGELITQGCNEVPKAFGGTYWDSEQPDFRDVKVGRDPNEELKMQILRDLFSRLQKAEFLAKEMRPLSASDLVAKALRKEMADGEGSQDGGPLVGAMVMDLTEYGRVVHAEMCAICDAARLGKSIKGSTLYCTTFPCHNCTKHILAAGVRKVVYIEPYPKSKARDLHYNEIEIEKEAEGRVSFVPFLGISPARYRAIFEKGRRKGDDGVARKWIRDAPQPMTAIVYHSYRHLEDRALLDLVMDVGPRDQDAASLGTGEET
jgi:cytidine deaminase